MHSPEHKYTGTDDQKFLRMRWCTASHRFHFGTVRGRALDGTAFCVPGRGKPDPILTVSYNPVPEGDVWLLAGLAGLVWLVRARHLGRRRGSPGRIGRIES